MIVAGTPAARLHFEASPANPADPLLGPGSALPRPVAGRDQDRHRRGWRRLGRHHPSERPDQVLLYCRTTDAITRISRNFHRILAMASIVNSTRDPPVHD